MLFAQGVADGMQTLSAQPGLTEEERDQATEMKRKLMFILHPSTLSYLSSFPFLLWTLNVPLDWNVAKVMSHFGSVLQTMLSLYMAVTGGNDWSLYYSLLEQLGSFYHTLFIAQPGCVSLRQRQKWVESTCSLCSRS